jgi:hypothetical protein
MKAIARITLGLVYLDLLFTKQRKEKETLAILGLAGVLSGASLLIKKK